MYIHFNDNLTSIILFLFFFLYYRPQGTILENVYFWFSLVFLVGRTVLMSLFAAKINDESKKPAIFIRAIPNANYSIEVGL